MIHADISQLHLDAEIQGKLTKATEDLRNISSLKEKYKFIDANGNIWRSTLSALTELTHCSPESCLCWYCESDGATGFYFQVDHFRPKKRVVNKGYKRDDYEPGYWWLAFNPKNYRISCAKCNTGAGKKDQFPLDEHSPRAVFEGGENRETILLLDPISDHDVKQLTFTQDGDVQPNYDCFPKDKKRADVSIAVYNLRDRSKREARRKLWSDCKENIEKAKLARNAIKETLLFPSPDQARYIQVYQDACEEIKKMTLINAKFSSTAKSCVKEYYKIERARAQTNNSIFDLEWLLDIL